jgi:hypothetical protein
MASIAYEKLRTALLVIDPYNDLSQRVARSGPA